MCYTWYSGWYNGLAKKHYINVSRSKEAEHEVIVYCKAHPDKKVIAAIGLVFDEMRAKRGIVLSKSRGGSAASALERYTFSFGRTSTI